jgi:hypothetical protein
MPDYESILEDKTFGRVADLINEKTIRASRMEPGRSTMRLRLPKKLSGITSALRSNNQQIFINTRIDPFILRMPEARDESIRRINIYQQTGVDGIFLPCITDIGDIRAAVSSTKLPINVLCMPDLPDFKMLKAAGVKRISMGDFAYAHIYKELEKATVKVLADGTFSKHARPSAKLMPSTSNRLRRMMPLSSSAVMRRMRASWRPIAWQVVAAKLSPTFSKQHTTTLAFVEESLSQPPSTATARNT